MGKLAEITDPRLIAITKQMMDVIAAWDSHVRRANIIFDKDRRDMGAFRDAALALTATNQNRAAKEMIDAAADLMDLVTALNSDMVHMTKLHQDFAEFVANLFDEVQE